MNADPEVMAHFPKTLKISETEELINKLKERFANYGYTYFATEILTSGEFIGFIGIVYQDYETEFNPATDIGWRLKKSAWGKGYATEGALKCLSYGFKELQLDRILSVCTVGNVKSENVMKKIGMKKLGEFLHPNLVDYPEHQHCLLYQIERSKT